MSGRVPRSHSVPKGHCHEGSARLSAKRTQERESLSPYGHAALFRYLLGRRYANSADCGLYAYGDGAFLPRLWDDCSLGDRPLITLPKGIKVIVFGLIHPNLKLVYPFR